MVGLMFDATLMVSYVRKGWIEIFYQNILSLYNGHLSIKMKNCFGGGDLEKIDLYLTAKSFS